MNWARSLVLAVAVWLPLCLVGVARAGMCGDGILDAGEQCDDGNAVETDGCSSNCMKPCNLQQLAGTAGCVSETGSGGACAVGVGLAVAGSAAVSPDGANVYATGARGLVFDRNATTGALTQKAGVSGCLSDDGSMGACTDATAFDAPLEVAVSPDGKNVYYAVGGASSAVDVFDRNTATGVLTQKAGTDGCISESGSGGACADGHGLLGGVDTVIVSPDGKNVYAGVVFGEGLAIFDRDAAGVLTQKGGTDGCISNTGSMGTCVDGVALERVAALAISPDGKNVYAAAVFSHAVAVFDRDGTGKLTQKAGTDGCISDGTVAACATGIFLNLPLGVAVSPDGKNVYVTGSASIAVFDRDAMTGKLTQKAGAAACVAGGPPCTPGRALAGANRVTVSPDGLLVVATSTSSDAVSIFNRNPTTGELSQRSDVFGCISNTGSSGCVDGSNLDFTAGLQFSSDGHNLYVAAVNSGALAIFGCGACGDGIVGADETCDDGNLSNSDTCPASCKTATCGDGFLCTGMGCSSGPGGGAEECDDGNTSDADTCRSNCANAACGDGVVCSTMGCTSGPNSGVEECDDGNMSDSDACSTACAAATCGDGILCSDGSCTSGPGGGAEECDDGNASDNDNCSTACAAATCGDGKVCSDGSCTSGPGGGAEECDDGNASDNDNCSTACAAATCGDATVCSDASCTSGPNGGSEQCDDGNLSNSDSCTTGCAAAACGDGFVCSSLGCTSGPGGGVEQCDDGNASNNDACPACAPAVCGDGFVCSSPGCSTGAGGGAESCDDGNASNDDACLTTCQTASGDDDGDGVSNRIENGAPNGGDANGDGTLDSLQQNVTSLPNATDGSYEILVTDAACPHTQVQAVTLSLPGYRLPFGALAFRLPMCPQARVTVYHLGADDLSPSPFAYVKTGPNPPGAANNAIYTLSSSAPHDVVFGTASLPYDPAVGFAAFTLIDGVLGDDTIAGDGIVDQGGPAIARVETAPTLSRGALGLVVSLFTGLAWLRLRRKRV